MDRRFVIAEEVLTTSQPGAQEIRPPILVSVIAFSKVGNSDNNSMLSNIANAAPSDGEHEPQINQDPLPTKEFGVEARAKFQACERER